MLPIAVCGMDCEKCNAYIAHTNDDDQLRAETAQLWSAQYNHPFKPEDINCTGCVAEGVKIGHCGVCPVRKCGMEKQVANCGQCDQMPCETLTGFFKMFPDNGAENTQRLKKS